ncbi:MAG: phenylalanine--tRNA ligase subunit beta [Betaproteobacteria bacterium]|nr:phenylalanine--tRNA ligase subunit beta [Betaproteobacteria bacterium]
MKFSENWLRTFVNPPLASRALADALTMSGVEVELVEPVAPPFDNVVVAEVLEVQKHPAADRLTVCSVSAGGAPLQVVCGAPNVRAGIRVPLARIGARLPGIEIKQAKVRGVESNGMLCSARELGLAEDASGLLVLPADAPPGADIREYLDLDDQLFTIKPTPNRGDCLSVFGFAREAAAVTGGALTPAPTAAVPAASSDRIEIALEDKMACPRYCGRIVRDVNARAATPRWMVQRLERSGLRSISAIVDVANYVMLELGQPLHAFDLARIDGAIRVRRGRSGEQLKLLNEQEVALDASLLVIADDRKPLALAGIMGGMESAVTPDTRDILLESAFFDPAAIAGKSRVLGFSSDSAYRFERGVDFAATVQAMERATRLVLDICGGKAGPVCAATARLPERKPLRLRRARAQRLVGIEFTAQQIADILRRLGFAYDAHGDEFLVTPPSYRFDFAFEEDLIEEVARIHGYDKIPANPPVGTAVMLPTTETRISINALRGLMVARDYQEIVSYSFIDRQWEIDFCANRDPVALANPIAAHLSVMRSGLIASLVDCLRLNLSRQQERVRLFETGRCFSRAASAYEQVMMLGGLAYGEAVPEQWGVTGRKVDFYDVKSDVEAAVAPNIAGFEAAQHPALHPGRSAKVTLEGVAIGWLGELHPRLQQEYDLPYAPMVFELNLDKITARNVPVYREVSRQPLVRRDLSVEVPETVSAQAMLDALRKYAQRHVSEVALFDVYRGKGIDSDKKSIAFKVLLQDTDKTLTDADVEATIGQMLQVLQEQFQAKLRK